MLSMLDRQCFYYSLTLKLYLDNEAIVRHGYFSVRTCVSLSYSEYGCSATTGIASYNKSLSPLHTSLSLQNCPKM